MAANRQRGLPLSFKVSTARPFGEISICVWVAAGWPWSCQVEAPPRKLKPCQERDVGNDGAMASRPCSRRNCCWGMLSVAIEIVQQRSVTDPCSCW